MRPSTLLMIGLLILLAFRAGIAQRIVAAAREASRR